jgi:hypothetical protein
MYSLISLVAGLEGRCVCLCLGVRDVCLYLNVYASNMGGRAAMEVKACVLRVRALIVPKG